MKKLKEGDRLPETLLQTYFCDRRRYRRVKTVNPELSDMGVEFPTKLRNKYPLGTKFLANVFVTRKPGKNKHLKAEHPIEVIKDDWFTSTHDRKILEERTERLLSIKNREKARGNQKPKKRTIKATQYDRDPGVRADVLQRACGKCELCNKKAPFKMANGNPFLEVHHAKPLGKDGSDTFENAFALCPNCHREAHYGKKKHIIFQKLIDRNLK